MVSRKGSGLPGILKGLATTARTAFRPTHTAEYPDVAPDLPPRSRGVIALLEENCTSCMLCARECPDWCIYIDSHKETIPATTEGGRDRQRNVLDRFAIEGEVVARNRIAIAASGLGLGFDDRGGQWLGFRQRFVQAAQAARLGQRLGRRLLQLAALTPRSAAVRNLAADRCGRLHCSSRSGILALSSWHGDWSQRRRARQRGMADGAMARGASPRQVASATSTARGRFITRACPCTSCCA